MQYCVETKVFFNVGASGRPQFEEEKLNETGKAAYLLSIKETEQIYKTDHLCGLTAEEATRRLTAYGKNKLVEGKKKSLIARFAGQFKDFLIVVLIAAAIISGFLGEVSDAVLILMIVVLNAVIGVVQESKAESAMESLKQLTIPEAKVIRDGAQTVVRSEDLVPGDLVVLDAGDAVPADGRIVAEAALQVQESALTGESVPVEKAVTGDFDDKTPLGDRVDMVYMSSAVTYGRGRFVVTGTGMDTEIGKIAGMLQTSEKSVTPLTRSINQLGKTLAIAALAACIVIFAVGWLRGGNLIEMFLTAVSLAVAAIPEGLPAVVTVVLAMGTTRLAAKHAIIRKLPAVETLGCASVICTDKTGTLTQNRMTIKKVYANEGIIDAEKIKEDGFIPSEKFVVRIGELCNDASIIEENERVLEIGDPTEVAMVAYADDLGFDKALNMHEIPRIGEIPFDSDRKLMTTIHAYGDTFMSFTKGAPDVLLARCTQYLKGYDVLPLDDGARKKIMAANAEMADNAYRVLGYAFRQYLEQPAAEVGTVEADLIFAGLTGMIDPPREEVKPSIDECRRAGIQTVMITGDHKNTAVAIAKDLDIYREDSRALSGVELDALSDAELDEVIEKTSVYARVSPEHKVRIVNAWQRRGDVVAMTGDGVNDAPALKKADIGCAMGITGTDVSKEAADMILTDDNFATIVSAVREGRGIYNNIKKAVHFLLSCNIAEILILFVATIIGWAQPLLPVHILWINLVTDSLPALALGVEKNDDDIMDYEPRSRNESIFAGGLGGRIVFQGIVLSLISLAVFWYGIHRYNLLAGRTMVFAVLGLSQLTHVLNVRSESKTAFHNLFTNRYLWGALCISTFVQLIVIFVPGLHLFFRVRMLAPMQWLTVALAALAPLVVVEVTKWLGRHFKND
ncbi:cation-translocating P-type ATPase [Pseudoramibacter alactolyticus]